MLIVSMTCIFPPHLLFLFCLRSFHFFLFHIFFLLRVCLPISVHIPSDHSANPASLPHFTYCPIFMSISHSRSFQPRLSYQHSLIKCWRTLSIRPFLIPFPFHPPPTGFSPPSPTSPHPICQNDRYHFINDPIPLFPHAHPYICFCSTL